MPTGRPSSRSPSTRVISFPSSSSIRTIRWWRRLVSSQGTATATPTPKCVIGSDPPGAVVLPTSLPQAPDEERRAPPPLTFLLWRTRPQMPSRERDLNLHLADGLVDDQGAVAGVVPVDLVGFPELPQPGHIVLNLADRTAGIVFSGDDQHRDANPIHVRDW